eukprot:m.130895 g.130895  ORF g.130895 m.130895 type:complete len:179 (-) comp52359_c0_seq27:97-633(-)
MRTSRQPVTLSVLLIGSCFCSFPVPHHCFHAENGEEDPLLLRCQLCKFPVGRLTWECEDWAVHALAGRFRDSSQRLQTVLCPSASSSRSIGSEQAPPTGLLITVQRHDGSKIDGAWIIFPGNQLFETDVNGEFLYSNGMTGTFDIDVQVDGFYPMTISVTVTNTELATLTLTMAAMDR